MIRRVSGRLVGVLAITLVLAGCTSAPEPAPTSSAPAITTPQASLAGEWEFTRTIIESDDPSREVGAESTRSVLIEQEDCGAAVCAGFVSSGATAESREKTALTQTDGGLEYGYTGKLNCLNAETQAVIAIDAFEYSQKAALTVAESDVEGDVTTATRLEGTITYTDTLTATAQQSGCTRDPAVVTVTYSVVAVRASGD